MAELKPCVVDHTLRNYGVEKEKSTYNVAGRKMLRRAQKLAEKNQSQQGHHLILLYCSARVEFDIVILLGQSGAARLAGTSIFNELFPITKQVQNLN